MSIQGLIHSKMDPFFLEYPPNVIADAYSQISNQIPLIFVLQTGKDPRRDLQQFATEMGRNSGLYIRGLGQG